MYVCIYVSMFVYIIIKNYKRASSLIILYVVLLSLILYYTVLQHSPQSNDKPISTTPYPLSICAIDRNLNLKREEKTQGMRKEREKRGNEEN